MTFILDLTHNNTTLLIQVTEQTFYKVSRSMNNNATVTTVCMTAVNTLQEHTALVLAAVASDNLNVVDVVVEVGVVD